MRPALCQAELREQGMVGTLGFEPRVRERDGVTDRRPFLQNIVPLSFSWCGREDLNLQGITAVGISGRCVYRFHHDRIFFGGRGET